MPYEPSLNRERLLQRTGAKLAQASTIDGIGTIVRKAVRDLIGQLPGREALFAMRRADELTVVATSSGRLAPSSWQAALVPVRRAERRDQQAARDAAETGGHARQVRVHARLPADRGTGHRDDPRLRGPGPLAAPSPGTVPPSELIEVAEETGLIIPLGSWTLKQAITDMARWRGTDPDPRHPKICINVSARQFRDPGFVAGLRQCLHETGLPAPAGRSSRTLAAAPRRANHVCSRGTQGPRRPAGDR